MSNDGRGSNGVASTDHDRRFEVKELPARRRLITAPKGGFVTGPVGHARAHHPGPPP